MSGMRKDLGLLFVRAAFGGALVAHGAQKLFGAFGGGGIDGTAAMFEMGGFRPARQHAMMAGLGEAGGGALLALGLATPAAGAAVAGTMGVAADLHRPNGFFAQKGGFEYPLILGAAGAALAVGGPGNLSVDRLLGNRLNRPWMGLFGLAAAAAAATTVVRRRQAALAAKAEGEEAQPTYVSGQAQSTVTRTSTQVTESSKPAGGSAAGR